jgi:hypothetical protein
MIVSSNAISAAIADEDRYRALTPLQRALALAIEAEHAESLHGARISPDRRVSIIEKLAVEASHTIGTKLSTIILEATGGDKLGDGRDAAAASGGGSGGSGGGRSGAATADGAGGVRTDRISGAMLPHRDLRTLLYGIPADAYSALYGGRRILPVPYNHPYTDFEHDRVLVAMRVPIDKMALPAFVSTFKGGDRMASHGWVVVQNMSQKGKTYLFRPHYGIHTEGAGETTIQAIVGDAKGLPGVSIAGKTAPEAVSLSVHTHAADGGLLVASPDNGHLAFGTITPHDFKTAAFWVAQKVGGEVTPILFAVANPSADELAELGLGRRYSAYEEAAARSRTVEDFMRALSSSPLAGEPASVEIRRTLKYT